LGQPAPPNHDDGFADTETLQRREPLGLAQVTVQLARGNPAEPQDVAAQVDFESKT
jgi:hypothetical protein